MSKQEGYYRGIRDEDGRFARSRYARVATTALIFVDRFRSKEVLFLGEHFPKEGAVIIIPNHPEGVFGVTDVPLFVAQEGRPVDMVVKEPLIFPQIQESSAVLKATQKTGEDVFSSRDVVDNSGRLGIKKRAKKIVFGKARSMMVPFIRDTVNAIPVDRTGESLRKTIQTKKSTNKTLAEGRVVVVPLQWTRTPQESLKNVKDLAADTVVRNKKVPVFVVAQVVDKNKTKHLIVDKPFVPEELEKELGRVLNMGEYTDLITDSMERLLRMKIPEVIR